MEARGLAKLLDIIGYILGKTGCIHPFRISRIIALAEIYCLEENNTRIMDIKYRSGPGVFYIEGLKEIIENNECFVKHEGIPGERPGCIEYVCSQISLPENISRYIDRAIEYSSRLSDIELNNQVLNNPLFKKLLNGS